MIKTLKEQLRCYEGQPVRLFTDDGRKFTGVVLGVNADCVTCIDACGRLFDFKLCHIDAVEEPQRALRECRKCKDTVPAPILEEGCCADSGCCTKGGCC